MLIRSPRLIINLVVLFFAVFFLRSSFDLAYAKDKNLADDFDYSNLSEKDAREEVKLLFKYAKKAYRNNDLETAKQLFFKILELDPYHPAANRYLDYLIPQKINRAEFIKMQNEQLSSDQKDKPSPAKQRRLEKSVRELSRKIERKKSGKQATQREQLAKLRQDEKIKEELKTRNAQAKKAKSKKLQTLKNKEQMRLEKENKVEEKKDLHKNKKDDAKNKRAEELEKKDQARLAKENKIKERLQARQEIIEEIKKKREQRAQAQKELKEANSKKKIAGEIVKKELTEIQKEQKLPVKKERLVSKNEPEEENKQELEIKKQEAFAKKEGLGTSKSGRKTKKNEELKQGKSREIKSRTQRLVEIKKRARLKAKKDKIMEAAFKKSKLIAQKKNLTAGHNKIEKPIASRTKLQEKKETALLEKYKEKTADASRKDKSSQIVALYKEAFYCFKVGKFDSAEAAFNKILELDSTQVKARDYLNIYIPQAKNKSSQK